MRAADRATAGLSGLDVDVLDPAHASGSGTRAADGLPWIPTLTGIPGPNGPLAATPAPPAAVGTTGAFRLFDLADQGKRVLGRNYAPASPPPASRSRPASIRPPGCRWTS